MRVLENRISPEQSNVPCAYSDAPYAPGWRATAIAGILSSTPIPTEGIVQMLSAAIDFWLLPATLFFDAFVPATIPVAAKGDACIAFPMPLPSAAQRVRRKRKVIRSKRGH